MFSLNSFGTPPSASSYSIAANGALTPVVGGTLPLQGTSSCPVGIAFVPPARGDDEDDDDGDKDDDDFDDDRERDDQDDDDDNDGKKDGDDEDDDNDGERDGEDEDDDNDGIPDEFLGVELDRESSRELQRASNNGVQPNGFNEYKTAVAPDTLLLISLVDAPANAAFTVEIYDPNGQLVSTAPSAAGRAIVTALPIAPGAYITRVRNASAEPVN